MLYSFLHRILNPVAKGLFHFKVIGKEHIPSAGGVILAANHVSVVDPFFLGLAVPRELNFMAKEELFSNRIFAWLLKKFNAFPVGRNRPGPSSLKKALSLLQEGQALLLFPEGTRGDGKNFQDPKSGVGFIAERSGSPVIPVYHEGTAKVMPRGFQWIRPYPVTVYFGEPLRFPPDSRGTKAAYQEFGALVMEKIAALKGTFSSEGLSGKKMKVRVARNAGFCFGVKRAYKLAIEATKKGRVYSLGPLIHNPQAVAQLEGKGLKVIKCPEEADQGSTLIVRSHGVSPGIIKKGEERRLSIVDATCPFVKKAQQNLVQLEKEGYQVVVVGDRDHPEVVSIVGHASSPVIVVSQVEELKNYQLKGKIGVIAQTTQSLQNLQEVTSCLLEYASELKILNTICNATTIRQEASLELAREVDIMIVVGGKNSANTRRLVQICKEVLEETYHVETAKEIIPSWLEGKKRVGVTAGASTPDWIISQVIERLEGLGIVKN